MIRRIRRKIRRIRYYSATPTHSAWSAAADVALLVAVALAWPATWLCDRMVAWSETAVSVTGQLARNADDGTHVSLVDREDRPRFDWDRYANLGRFSLSIDDEHRGWPFTTTIARQRAVIDLDLYSEPQPRTDVRLPPVDPLRGAIESGLEAVDETEALATFRNGPPAARSIWLNWLAGTGVWWILLTFALVAGVRLMQFGAMHLGARHEGRRAARLATGRCADCGYDLRGLEFNERCPECGALVE